MKYFGEFLVLKGIITEDVLLDALFQQARAQPSPSEIAFRKKLIPCTQILHALKLQHEENLNFKLACQKLGVWSDSFDQSILNEIKYNHLPLGQVLVRSGAADLTVITKALDEFLSKVELPQQKHENTDTPQAGVRVQPRDSVRSEAQMDPILLEELISALSQEKLDSMRECLALVRQAEGPTRLDHLRTLVQEIHTTRGLLRCVQMEKMETLVTTFENVCVSSVDQAEKEASHSVHKLCDLGVQLIQLIDEFMKVLASEPSEKAWFKEEGRSKRYDDLLKPLVRFS